LMFMGFCRVPRKISHRKAQECEAVKFLYEEVD